MKIKTLIEGRKNPAQNIKYTLQDLIERHQTTEGELFVSFQNHVKLGSNPRSTWETPAGVYAYPYSYVLERGKKRGYGSTIVPYGGGAKFCYIFKHAGKMLNVANQEHLDQLTEQVKTLFKGSSDDPQEAAQQAEDEFIKLRNGIDQSDTFSTLLAIIKVQIGAATYEPMSITKLNHKYAENGVNSGPYAVSAFFIKHGWTGLIDFGNGFIYATEKTQAVFFNGIEVIDMEVLKRAGPKAQNSINIQQKLGKVGIKAHYDEGKIEAFGNSLIRAVDNLFAEITGHTEDSKRIMRVFRNQFNKIRRNIIEKLDITDIEIPDADEKAKVLHNLKIINDPDVISKIDAAIEQFGALVDFINSAKFTKLVVSVRSLKVIFHGKDQFLDQVLHEVGHETSISTSFIEFIYHLTSNRDIKLDRLKSQLFRRTNKELLGAFNTILSEFRFSAIELSISKN